MADPFSLALGGITIVQVAAKVVSLGMAYGQSVANLPEEVQTLISEISLLSGVLNSLCASLQKTGPADTSPHLVSPELLDGPIKECQTQLEGLHSFLEKHRSRKNRLRHFGRKLKWPMKAQETREWIQKVERYKTTFSLALDVEQVGVKRKTCNDVAAIRAGDEADRMERKLEEKSALYIAALQWLSAADPRVNQIAARKLQQAGTGSWLTESDTFHNWRGQDNSFLWLYGTAGAGKTILSSIIVDRLIQEEPDTQTKTLYFYCDFKDVEKMDADGVYRSLTAQILQANWANDIPPEFKRFYDENSTRPPQRDLLKQELLRLVNSCGRTRIVVDALDECNAAERVEILQTLFEIQNAGRVNLLVTSRESLDIKLAVGERNNLCIQSSLNKADIEMFVRHEVERNDKLNRLKDDTKAEIISKITAGADGMFQWAKLSLDQLRRLRNTKAIKEALQALPAGLDEVYERILDNISAEDRQLARRAFNWLACAPRPMRISELVEAIAIERGTVRLDPETKLNGTEDLLEICGSLVTVDQDVDTIVLSHPSVKEFLISSKLQLGPWNAFFINLTETNFTVAGLCLAYLSFENFRSGPCATGQELVDRFTDHPLYSYATSNWPYHAKEHVSVEDWSLLSLIEHFFLEASGNFEAWTQAFEATKDPLHDSEIYLRWDFMGNNRLVYACRLGLYSSTQFLLSKGFDINTVCTSKMKDEMSMFPRSHACGTALNAACTSGNLEVVKLLLKNGADINGIGGHMGLPLINAVNYGNRNNDDFRILEHLLNSGADINRSNSTRNAFFAAVGCRSSAAARILVKHGADITMRDNSGFSLLEAASIGGYVSEGIFSTLIDLGAAAVVHPEFPGGLPPGTDAYALVMASQNNFFDIAAKILKKDGEKIFSDPGFKLLIYIVCKCCAHQGFYKFLQHMVVGCGSNFPGFEECVSDAAVHGHLQTLETLLNAWKRTEGNTARSPPGRPLILAAARGHKSVVEWLLKFGEVPTATDEHGWSAILAASVNKQEAIIELFKSRGHNLSGSEKPVLPSSWQPFTEWAEEIPKNVFINGATVELAADATENRLVFFDRPLPPRTSSYYFEITILSAGSPGAWELGLDSALLRHFDKTPQSTRSGLYNNSLVYRSSGEIFARQGKAKNVPKLVDGSVVGIYVDFEKQIARFTHDGVLIKDVICRDVGGMLNGAVILRPGAKVKANFGAEGFVFRELAKIGEIGKGARELRFAPEAVDEGDRGCSEGAFMPVQE